MPQLNAFTLQKKYPKLQVSEINNLIEEFSNLDVSNRGYLESKDIQKFCSDSGHGYDEVRATLQQVNTSNKIDEEEFIELVHKLKEGKNKGTYEVDQKKIKVQGTSANVTHTINEDERVEFTRHINQILSGDPHVDNRLPIPTHTMQLFDECKDGLILCKLINDAVPDTIDERVLNVGKVNDFQSIENNNIAINSAKAIGLSVVNIGSSDIIEAKEHLILGLIWQIIRRGLLNKVDIKLHPELYRLLEDGETLEEFLRLPPDQILLRWFNYHLKAAGWERRVKNFGRDLADSENYTVLLHQLKPDTCSRNALQESDLLQRAEMVLSSADAIGCRKYLTANAIVKGNPKLNLAFVANLFNTHPGLDPLTKEEVPEIEMFDAEGEREARVFTLWLNSLNVQPGVYNLFEDLQDGWVLLQAFDIIAPGIVKWRLVSRPPPPPSPEELLAEEQSIEENSTEGSVSEEPTKRHGLSRFKQIENCNYAVLLGLERHLKLVGIQGADITDGQRTLTLALLWQMMREHIIATLQSLTKAGEPVTDQDMIRWANETAQRGGKSSTITSFKDTKLRSGVFFLDVLNGMKPGYVDYSLVNNQNTDEAHINNAKLAISIARKLGATIFLVPEDIVDVEAKTAKVKQKLMLTFIGSLMVVAQTL